MLDSGIKPGTVISQHRKNLKPRGILDKNSEKTWKRPLFRGCVRPAVYNGILWRGWQQVCIFSLFSYTRLLLISCYFESSLSTSVSDPVPDWSRIKAGSVDQDPVPDFRILIQARKSELQNKKNVKKLHVLMCCLCEEFRIRNDLMQIRILHFS